MNHGTNDLEFANPSQGAGRRRRDRSGREASLLSVAGKLFASRGYDATTTREIAAWAGCAEGLISRYFKGKAGLLRALIGAHNSKKHNSYNPPGAACDFEQEIVQLVGDEVEQIWEDREFYRAIIPTVLRESGSGPKISQIALAMESDNVTRRLEQSRYCRDLDDEQRATLARLINVNAFIFGFWYPIALGQGFGSAKESANTMAGLIAEQFRNVGLRIGGEKTLMKVAATKRKTAVPRISNDGLMPSAELVI